MFGGCDMPVKTTDPPVRVKLFGHETRGGSEHAPYLGSVARSGIQIYQPKSKTHHEVSFLELIRAGARAAGCSAGEFIAWLEKEAGASSSSEPGAPDRSGVRHGRLHRRAG